jgi:hypothetical protein
VEDVKGEVDDSFHDILKVELKPDSEPYILDLSGAQYGYINPVIPWSVYKQSRIQDHEENVMLELGYWKDNREKEIKDTGDIFLVFEKRASDRLLIETMKWEKEQKITVKDMLQLPERDFEIRKNELVEHIDTNLKAFLEKWNREMGG